MAWYYSADDAPVGPHSADEIENLFVTGQLTAETLVWRKGLAEWTPLADTDEFAHLVDDALPPALPVARQQATAADRDGEVLVADRLGDYRPGSDRADDDDDDDDGDDAGHPGFSTAHVAPVLAGLWSRYFARSIDISIIATVLLTGFYWVLPAVNLQLYLPLYFVDIRALVILAMPPPAPHPWHPVRPRALRGHHRDQRGGQARHRRSRPAQRLDQPHHPGRRHHPAGLGL